ncbi:MAG: hypothetical protein K2X66_14685, partial [Cyanobacteria bacterium]|nr:hypothetical protein [Cyanobacteriota bacterium]
MMIQLKSQYPIQFAGLSWGASLKKTAALKTPNGTLASDVFEKTSGSQNIDPALLNSSVYFGAQKPSEITSSAQVAQKMDHIPSALEFRTLLSQERIAAVGSIPEGLETCGLSKQELVQNLDALSNALRYLDGHISNTERSGNGTASVNLPEMVLTLGNEKVLLKKGGYGAVGHVYKLQIKGKNYALKVYNDPERLDIHGAWAETGLGTYLAKFQIKNNVPMILANPNPQGGWSITDWVDKGNHAHLSQRQGTDLESLLASEGLYMNDLWGPNLGPGGLLWDLGGVLPKAKAPIRTLSDFEQLLKNPNTQRSAGRRIGELRGVEANNALFRALADPAVRAQAVIKCASASSPEERDRLFLEAMAYPESRGVAAYDLHKTTPATQWKVF